MIEPLSLELIARICEGDLKNVTHPLKKDLRDISQISTDTRTLQAGDVFVALRGEKTDGSHYIEEAIRKGAKAIVTETEPSFSLAPVIVVSDSLKALAAMGKHCRSQFQGRVFAITGSAGKSSTKYMLSILLGDKTVSSPESYNNLLGLSKTLLLVSQDTKNLVLEMGMNARGEIQELCETFSPQGGCITTIGTAHIGKLGSEHAIYLAKKELFDFLARPNTLSLGIALNESDPKVKRAFEACFGVELFSKRHSPQPKVIPYGVLKIEVPREIPTVRLVSSSIDPETAENTINFLIHDAPYSAKLPIFGDYQAINLMASLACGMLMGRKEEEMIPRISELRAFSHRGEIHYLTEDTLLIDESYNSNPTALEASLNALSRIHSRRSRILVLGEMGELGEFSIPLHARLGSFVGETHEKSHPQTPLYTLGIGRLTEHLISSLQRLSDTGKLHSLVKAEWIENASDAFRILSQWRVPGSLLYFKGSHSVGLSRVVQKCQQMWEEKQAKSNT